MLSVDYKILATVLASRMKKVLPSVIHDTQTGFLSKRQISTTIRTTIDITKYNKKIKGYFLNIDFRKCFDLIEYAGIMGSLKLLGFPNIFLEWSALLMNQFTSATSNNIYFSEFFEVSRLCHQGCPAAPLYYLACGEILSHKVRKNSKINGITLNELENIIAQFADDTQCEVF